MRKDNFFIRCFKYTQMCVCIHMHNMCKMKKNPKTKAWVVFLRIYFFFFYLRLLNLILSIKLHLGKTLNCFNHKMECSNCALLCLVQHSPRSKAGPASALTQPCQGHFHRFHLTSAHKAKTAPFTWGEALEHPHQLSFLTQPVWARNSRLVQPNRYHCLDFNDKNPGAEEWQAAWNDGMS